MIKRPEYDICQKCDNREYKIMLSVRKWVGSRIDKKFIVNAMHHEIRGYQSDFQDEFIESDLWTSYENWDEEAIWSVELNMFFFRETGYWVDKLKGH